MVPLQNPKAIDLMPGHVALGLVGDQLKTLLGSCVSVILTDPRLIQRISAETGAKAGGTLYSDALTDPKGPAPTYIDLIRHNIRTLSSALMS